MTNEQAKCRFCGVLASHGHFDWCKVTRAPSPSEVMQAVIDEEGRCVGGEGPSSGLADMAKAALAALPAEPKADPTCCAEPGCGNMGTYVDGRCGYHTAAYVEDPQFDVGPPPVNRTGDA